MGALTGNGSCYMDLATAFHRLNTPVQVHGVSNASLVAEVEAACVNEERKRLARGHRAVPRKALTVATGLDSGTVVLRPIDALQRLARATALNFSEDVLALNQAWSWLRYLGAFDHRGDPPSLTLHRGALRGVRANQRRVVSEELGVGFGILLAEHWCQSLGAPSSVDVVDVDNILGSPSTFPNWAQAAGSRRQPDYLLQYQDPANSTQYQSRLLETKGTVARSNATGQLARASTQLASLHLDGNPVQGVAIVTVSNSDDLSYLAIDPEAGRSSWAPDDSRIDAAKYETPVMRRQDGLLFANRDEFLSSARVAANASLAEFAGLDHVKDQWIRGERRESTGRKRREPKSASLDHSDYFGVEFTLPVGNGEGTVTVFQGVHTDVASALETGKEGLVRQAQDKFREANPPEKRRAAEGHLSEERAVTSVSGEGAILRLTQNA